MKVQDWFFGALLIGLAAATQGCVIGGVVGTPKAVREYYDGENGRITEAKATADIKSAYYQRREQQEKEETTRDVAPGFWQKLVGGAQ
jgi:Na+/glutamate symporter